VSTRDEKQASKGIWLANILNIPIMWLFLLLGTALYLFYANYPEKLNPVMDQPDSILPWFIVLELPPGVSGLLIAGIFAASMSSLEASINSMSTVFVKDFYERFGKKKSDASAVKLGKWLVVTLGVIGTGTGLILASSDITSLYDRFFELIGLFGGGLGGIFLLGMMTERGSSKGVLIGFIASGLILYYVSHFTSLNFFLYLFIGMMSCFIVGYLASLLLPDKGKSLDGLTIHTLTR
jgi:solute:Na+ symporter, SSS family